MKAALNNKLAESRAAAKIALEEEYKMKFEQEKQIWIAEHTLTAGPAVLPSDSESTATATVGKAAPAIPTGKSSTSQVPELSNMSDAQIRELLSTNQTAKAILTSNLKKKLEIETQKLRDEYEKSTAEKFADAAKKVEDARTQAVLMEGKKSALKINMAENKLKAANAKIEIIEKAATVTPQKPVGEVWEIAKNAKPSPSISVPNTGKCTL